jgi:hypothetical protein
MTIKKISNISLSSNERVVKISGKDSIVIMGIIQKSKNKDSFLAKQLESVEKKIEKILPFMKDVTLILLTDEIKNILIPLKELEDNKELIENLENNLKKPDSIYG